MRTKIEEKTTEAELNKVCRDIRKDRPSQQWLKEHPETRRELLAIVVVDDSE